MRLPFPRIDRREFLRVSSLAALAAAATRPSRAHAATTKPNVLFIAIDDLNDWIGCLDGHPNAKTPNLDRLATRAMLFNHAYCAAPACNPSRVAIMTGIQPSNSGVYTNHQPWRPTMPDVVTLQRYFMAHGYRAIGRGKIYHGAFQDTEPGSWDEYIPQGDSPKPEMTAEYKAMKERVGAIWSGWIPGTDEDMDDNRVARWAAEQLHKDHGQPFFLACGFRKPHMPWHVPKQYFDMHPLDSIALPETREDDLDDVPEPGRLLANPDRDHKAIIEAGYWRQAVRGYLAACSFVDAQIGMVLDAYESSPHRDNTILVLWSDHGWHLGEKLHWRKFTLWEEAARNILVFSVPGITRPGVTCERTVNLLDIYPTLLDLCGLPQREGLDGISLRPLLENPEAPWDRPSLTTYGRNQHSLRTERWRYIRYADGSEELYDHQNDDMEWTNLAQRPEYAAVKQELAQWFPKVNAPDVPEASKEERELGHMYGEE